MKIKKLTYLIQISIFASIAELVMLFKFPIFFVPSFYKLDFSDSIILISAFSLGPTAGALTQLIKLLLCVVIKGSSSFGIGELADFILGLSLVLPCALIYKRYRTFKGAYISMIIGILILTFVSALVNYFFIIPLYQSIFSLSEDIIVSMAHSLNPLINDKISFILFAVCPFNLLKGMLVCFITLMLYKRLSGVINKISKST